MSYENANATKVLATHCCACGRPLVDSVSVQSGMGPDCRKKYFVSPDISEEARTEANALVYRLAEIVSFENPTKSIEFAVKVLRLRQLGFDKLSTKIISKIVQIKITEKDGFLCVSAPYNEDTTVAWRAIPGRRWDKDAKVNKVPVAQKRALWDLLKTFYNGKAGLADNGAFVVA